MPDGSALEQKLTPMMEQYRSIKKTLPSNTILFFRLGDFYEMFFDDAVLAADILDITLTGREGGEAGRVPMCGVPYHSYQGYVRTLLDRNYKVAICEQIGDPKLAKGLVERKIARIVSPATNLEDDEECKRFEYMAALQVDADRAGMAYLDLGTGEFFVREVARDRLKSELAALGPREVILPKVLADGSDLASYIKEGLGAGLTVYEDWVFDPEEGLERLVEGFRLAAKEAVSFREHPLALSASGAILYYLRDHLHAAWGHIRPPCFLEAGDSMILDRSAQRSLELVAGPPMYAADGKKSPGTLLSCIDQTLTSMGGRLLYHWLIHPLLSSEEIAKRQEGVRELVNEPARTQSLRALLKGIKDLERTLSRLNCGVANARDLVNLKVFLERIPQLQALLAALTSPLMKDILGNLIPFPNLKELIESAIVDEPPSALKEGGLIRDGYSRDLDELRRIAKSGKSWILEFERREVERTGIKSLRIRYSQVFGYTIEVSKSNLHLVPDDYTRKQTLANGERFIVPALREWDEKISGAQEKMRALEYELFNSVREKILEELVPLQSMARAVGMLDALGSLAVTAAQRGWVRPTVVDSGELLIEGGRHPGVEAMLPAGQFVANDTYLDRAENQLIVLTGPNMAGKSTYIRQVGLIVILAQMGSFVPASRARIGLVDRIFTRIGASDNLSGGESTFMVEMIETAQILQSATRRSLLILDEVGRGTSTFDGVSIAWAVSEYLASGVNRPRTLFATHYHELTQLEKHFSGIKNYKLTVKETRDDIVFLRKVVRGGSERSYGIHVARLAGIPKSVTDRAARILAILESESTEATQIIEGKKEDQRGKNSDREPTLFDGLSETQDVKIPDRHPILDEIRELALDGMTPLQALNKLAQWKERLRPEGPGEKTWA